MHNAAQMIRNITTSAADAEIGALYINSSQAIPARHLLEEMGHKQSPTPIQTDNTTVLGFVTKNLQPKATKSMEMNYWFMRDRQDRQQFKHYWRPGKGNQGDLKFFVLPRTKTEGQPFWRPAAYWMRCGQQWARSHMFIWPTKGCARDQGLN